MCGIIGIQGGNYPEIEKIVDIINHRGPDDRGTHIIRKNNLSLGHVRLSILDLSYAGHQPMIDELLGITIVYNGEIYNFRDLKNELKSKGFKFKSNSDTEVLIYAYIHFGNRMVEYLNGIFSFAIWDQNKEELFLSRDRFGVKPLYYYNENKNFYFASEIKSILPLLKNRQINHSAINKYLKYLYCPGIETAIKYVYKVAPGESLIVKDAAIKKKWQWISNEKKLLNNKEFDVSNLILETSRHLRSAVHTQMVSDVPLGSFLSGGLDSTSIAAFAREINPNIECFTINSIIGNSKKDSMNEDFLYANKAAKFLGLPLNTITVNPKQMAQDFEKMIWHLDEPVADLASLNTMYISEEARKIGIKVLLSGTGGDDIFTGYRRHQAINFEYLWNWMPQGIKKILSSISSRMNKLSVTQRRFAKIFIDAHLNKDERLVNYFSWISNERLNQIYSKDFKDNLFDSSADETMLNFIEKLDKSYSDLEKMLLLEQRFFLGDHNLLYTDKMSMAHGVEIRVPFLENNLVDFVSRIPINLKQKGHIGKWILKKSMRKYLPEEIIYRKKNGFGVPLRDWLKNDFEDLIYSTLSKNNLQGNDLFSPLEVSNLLDDNRSGKIDASYTILSLMSTQIWIKKFLN